MRYVNNKNVSVIEARTAAGVDPAWILVEHNARPDDVNGVIEDLRDYYAQNTGRSYDDEFIVFEG